MVLTWVVTVCGLIESTPATSADLSPRPISPQTVTTHVKTIYRKLEITSRAEAALEARKRGLA
ncbi:MAG: response regulator transcription factor, partial [Sphingomonadales bacterium]